MPRRGHVPGLSAEPWGACRADTWRQRCRRRTGITAACCSSLTASPAHPALRPNLAGRKLRCVGSGLSPNGLSFNEDGMVSLTLMDKILEIDEDKKQVGGRGRKEGGRNWSRGLVVVVVCWGRVGGGGQTGGVPHAPLWPVAALDRALLVWPAQAGVHPLHMQAMQCWQRQPW